MTGRYLSNRAGTRWDTGLRRALKRVRGSLLRRPHPGPPRGPARGLDDHERVLADLQRLAQIGTLTWDLDTGSISWSSEIYRILGLRDHNAPPTLATWRELVHPDDRAEFDHGLAEMSRKLTTYAASYRIIRPDGRVRTLECHGHIERDANGDPCRVVGTAQDITAIALAEERFRSLFRAAPYPQVVMDRTGLIVLANSAADALFGTRDGGLQGRTAEELIPIGSEFPWYLRVEAGAPPASSRLELQARRADGTPFPVEVTLTPLLSEEGTLICAAIRDETERKHAAEALAYRASHDALTGLPNRALFLDRLEHALARARRSSQTLAVMFLDLDDFKLVNDTRGHDVGDLLLVALTPRLRAALRPGDTIARFGGDEFVVLCEELTGTDDATVIAERIKDACRGPMMIGDREHVVTVSVGVVVVSDPSAATPSRVLRDADAAMYRAKDAGKGEIELFDEGMRVRLMERVAIEGALRQALEHDELRLVYQPIMALGHGRIVALEALLRWEHPQRGLLYPDEFIPAAERSGLIVDIGAWVLERACRQAAAWRDNVPHHTRPVRVSVNVSPRQLAHGDLVATVGRVLTDTGLEPGLLELELTEQMLADDIDQGIESLSDLKSLGVRLVLDDFGTGYSSLSYLRQLTIDALKIDRSFVDGLGRGTADGAIVGAVLSMAGALGLGVTAEGVETQAQLARLREHGCDYAQGFLFCRPSSADDVTELLRTADHAAARWCEGAQAPSAAA
jgi:diguanylate cyclase (GGDEF)-like protein/PAS domain S-box-containing protein